MRRSLLMHIVYMFVVQRYSLMLESAGGLLHREHGPRQRQGATAAAKPAANQTVDDAMRSGAALPLAVGNGRHVRLLGDCGFAACAVDHDTTSLLTFAGPSCGVRRVDLETDEHWRSAASMMES